MMKIVKGVVAQVGWWIRIENKRTGMNDKSNQTIVNLLMIK